MKAKAKLWEIFKEVGIPLYINGYGDNTSESDNQYLFIRTDIANYPFKYGDGKFMIRASDCDLAIVFRGVIWRDMAEKAKVVEDLLEANDIRYVKTGDFYDSQAKQHRIVYAFSILEF